MCISHGGEACLRCPRFWLIWLLALILFALPTHGVLAAFPTASEVLAKLRARRESVRNVRLEARWQEYEKGRPSRWSEDRICRDNLGRIRIICYHGSGAIGTGPRKMVNDLFNGEMTIQELRDPTRDHFGKSLKSDRQLNSPSRFWVAIINDGEWPPQGGLSSHRDPLTCVDGPVINDLSKLISSGTSVVVKPVGKQQDLYEVRYKLDSKSDPDHLERRFMVDAAKGWVITRYEQSFQNGKSARLIVCDYKANNVSGLWIPAKGQFLNLWGKDVPDLDWRFSVRGCVVNDPAFDESIFDIKLTKGVYVTDNRYKVSYTVGEDVVSGDDLAGLAERAREAEDARRKPRGIVDDTRGGLRWYRRALVGVGAGVGIFLVVIAFVRRKMLRKNSS